MAASQVRNIACLLHDMVQEYAAKTSALRRLVHRNLPEEQHRQLAMTRCPTRAAMKFLYIHHAQVDRMVAENSRTPLFDNDIDTSHVVLLLFPCAELEVVVEANNTAVEVSAVMPRRIETLDSEGLLLIGSIGINNALPIVPSRIQGARSGSWGRVKGGSKLLSIVLRQDVARLCFEHADSLAFNCCAQEN